MRPRRLGFFVFLLLGFCRFKPGLVRLGRSFGCCFSSLDHILARDTLASQYRFMPQQRPEMSSFKSGFASRVSIQSCNASGTFESFVFSSDMDMEIRVWVSGFVS